MGTRGLSGFHYKGNDYLQYNHFDSYPKCLGQDFANNLVEELSGKDKIYIQELLEKVKLVDCNSDQPNEEELLYFSKFSNEDERSRYSDKDSWRVLLMPFRGNVIELLKQGVLDLSNDFIRNSLFCEWCYIFNVDTYKLEVYVGYQLKKDNNPNNRYKDLEPMIDLRETFYPCKLIHSFQFIQIMEPHFDIDFELKKYLED